MYHLRLQILGNLVALSYEAHITVSIPTGTCCPLTGDVILTPCATKDVVFVAPLAVVFDICDVDGIGVSGDGRIFARICSSTLSRPESRKFDNNNSWKNRISLR